MIGHGISLCSSFLISACMFNVFCVECFVHIECYSYCSNPFAMVLFNVCSAVTVECCVLYRCCVGGFGIFAVM